MRFRKCAVLVSLLWAVAVLGVSTASAPAYGNTIVVLGDSLSSGYGLQLEQSWVSRLEGRLEHEGYGYTVVNASIAGDTSSGGLARLPSLLAKYAPAIVIIELGGNDGLRGHPVASLRANLEQLIQLVREHGAAPVLAGIQIPPNYGPAYAGAFAELYPAIATELDVPLVGFLLEDVALNADLMQADGIHPNARGNEVMLDNVWAVLAALL